MAVEDSPKPRTTAADALELFILDGATRRLSPATLEFYRAKLGPFVAWLEEHGAGHVDAIDAGQVRQYQAAHVERGISAQYQHNIARSIKAFVRFMEREGLIARAPNVTMPKLPKRILPSLTPAEVRQVLSACGTERDRAIVLLMLDTGLRAGELVRLAVGDVDLPAGRVLVRQGKGQKDRFVYIGQRTRAAVRAYFAARGHAGKGAPAFASHNDGGRLTVWGLVQLFERLRDASGVDMLTAHTLRRTFALTCLRNGMNVYVLARLMGHADIQVLRHYLALVESDLADAHSAAGPVDHMK